MDEVEDEAFFYIPLNFSMPYFTNATLEMPFSGAMFDNHHQQHHPNASIFAVSDTTGWPPEGRRTAIEYPVHYRVIGTFLQSIIFTIGFFGNIMICVVVHKTRSLHTPTYCYLVSLAVADTMMICTAIPDIISHHLYAKQWVLGQAGCSIIVFTSFLAINAGSISIVAFTVERYIAICHPMLAQKVCSLSRARRIIALTWLVVGVYCFPWFFLTATHPLRLKTDLTLPEMRFCGYTLSRSQYLPLYMFDFIIFYVTPLLIAMILYTKMSIVLHNSVRATRHQQSSPGSANSSSTYTGINRAKQKSQRYFNRSDTSDSLEGSSLNYNGHGDSNGSAGNRRTDKLQTAAMQSRCQVVKMLMIVVACFAFLWLPYRGVLVYNSVVETPYQNMWYIMFAKTLVYLNSAINPFLYTVLSRKFRSAFFRIVFCWKTKTQLKKRMTYSVTEMSLRTASGCALQMATGMSMTFNEKLRLRECQTP